MGTLRADLGEMADEVWETHISWVFAVGEEVFKVKKPVALGFLDFSSPELRRDACEAENALNVRLTEGVYRGVVPITRGADGHHRIDGDGETVDWAVRMRRLRSRDRADRMLARGRLGVAEVDRMAARIARFHAECHVDELTAAMGMPDAIRFNVRENFEQTRAAIQTLVRADEAQAIERWQVRYIDEHEDLLRARAVGGRVRDGHGDLRLEHFYLEGEELRVIDCIEFNERFRYGDVCADIAFLSMDLGWHGHVDLAERALATYARESNDFGIYPLVDFYESYRAYVRGKIAMMLAGDDSAPPEARARASTEARRFFLLALAKSRRSLLPPTLVAIGGALASGKSTLADHLGAAMGAPTINTDRVRKHMLGARPTDRLYEGSWSGAYDPAFTEEVYAEVGRRAEAVLRSGRPVILDASFRTRAMRAEAAAIAERAGVPFKLVECRAPLEVCRARLRARDPSTSVSDGRLEIFDDFVARMEPIDELGPDVHLVADTTRPVSELLEELRRDLPMWPRREAPAPERPQQAEL